MGELPPVQSFLSDHRPLHGPEGRTHAHQAAGGPVGRETGGLRRSQGFYFEGVAETGEMFTVQSYGGAVGHWDEIFHQQLHKNNHT